MKQLSKNTNSTRKKILITVLTLIVAAIAAVGTMALMKIGPFTPAASTSDKDSSTTTGGDTSPTTPDTPGEDVPEKTPGQNDPGEEQAPDGQLAGSITAANQNADMLQIRTLIETVSSDGSCNLTLTKDGRTVTRTAGIYALANASTCQGFDIPMSELSPGQWQLTIDITVGGKQTQLTKTIDLT